MCSGRVEPFFIFESLMQKIDGIIIMGCHLGDCHYMTGNHEALHKYDLIAKLLKLIDMSGAHTPISREKSRPIRTS